MTHSEILTAIITLIGSTGFQWLLNFRANRKQVSTKVAVEEFQGVQTVVESSMSQMNEMMTKFDTLHQKYFELNQELQKERLLSTNLRTDLNKLMNECNCDDTIKSRIKRDYQL